jgi:DNA polymerase III delta prime subunit
MTGAPSNFLGDNHVLMLGKTGVGKTSLLQALARSIAVSGEGFTFPDLHGEGARDLAEWIASPGSGCADRRMHFLNFRTSIFGLNIFQCDPSPESYHAAANMWASILESVMDQKSEQLPRLARINYVVGYALAEKKLTLLDMPAFLSLGGEHLRERVLANFDHPMIAAEISELHTLAAKYPREFLNMVEASKNRNVRWLGNPDLAAVLGQPNGLDAQAVMDAGDIVLCDLSALTPADAAFLAKVLAGMYALAARRRKPHASRMHRLLLDESDSILCNATTELLDALRKFRLTGIFSLQRTKQANSLSRPNGDTIFDALMVNTGIKIIFNIPEPDTAEYLARTLFSTVIDLQEFKPKSARPLAVANRKVIVHGKSRATHEAQAHSHAEIDSRSWARASAAMSASMSSAGAAFGSGDNISFASVPPDTLLAPGTHVGTNTGRNNSNHASSARGFSSGRSSSTQYARGRARSDARADTQGVSECVSQMEAYVTQYEERCTEFFTLPEQIHRYTSVIMSLDRREVILKVEGQQPIRTRTLDLAPAFKNADAKKILVPLYLEQAARRSSYVMSIEEARANIAARLDAITKPEPEPQPDFTAREPMPVIDAPEDYARGYLRRSEKSAPRRPTLRVVGKSGDGDISK